MNHIRPSRRCAPSPSPHRVGERIGGGVLRIGSGHDHSEMADESMDTAESFAYLEGKLNHAKVPNDGINDLLHASVPALNSGHETTADTSARRRVALAGPPLGKKLKALF